MTRAIIQLPTPLHERTAEQSRTNQWQAWNGFTVPTAFGDVAAEARAIVRTAGLADLSPQPSVTVAGSDAGDHLDRLLTRRVSDLSQGETREALMCVASGYVIDKCIIARTGEEEFIVIANEVVGARLTDMDAGRDVSVVPGADAMIGVGGPARAEVLNATGLNAPIGQDGFVQRLSARGIDITLIDLPADRLTLVQVGAEDAGLLWNRFAKQGTALGLVAVGMAAQERHRIDQGIARAGQDFVPATIARRRDECAFPAELGWAHLVELDGRPFSGATALRASPGGRAFAQISIPQAFDLTAARLSSGGKKVGTVTSSYAAPEHAIARGLALIDRSGVTAPVKLELSNGIITPEINYLR